MSDYGIDQWGDLERLRELVSRPYLIDLLDVLEGGPLTIEEMRFALPGARRRLVRALRDLVAAGLVIGGAPGSRDALGSDDELYQHSERGRATVELLSRFSVWTALYGE